jgi:hypothetical protein
MKTKTRATENDDDARATEPPSRAGLGRNHQPGRRRLAVSLGCPPGLVVSTHSQTRIDTRDAGGFSPLPAGKLPAPLQPRRRGFFIWEGN